MKKLGILHLQLFCILFLPLNGYGQPELNAAKVERNVVFGTYSGLALLMDVYYPENPNGYGIIHIAGSGWMRSLSLDATLINRRRHVKFEGEMFVEAGYTLFSINHRALPRFTYPAAVEDAQRAVRFIRYNAESYGINPKNIGAIGGSSGGYLVSMLGVLDESENLEDDTPVNKMSAKVQCVIARAAPTNFMSGEIGQSFLGFQVRENPSSIEYKRAYGASPINHVSMDDPPFLFIHGDRDEVVPLVMSEEMYSKLHALNITTKLIVVEGGVHGPGVINSPGVKQKMVEWMDQHLKKRQ